MIQDLLERFYAWQIRRSCRYIPRHIAIIQDGNRRYAKGRGLGATIGHRAGADKTEVMLDWAHELGIEHITLYSFSTENFNRESREITELFGLFKDRFIKVLEDPRVHRYHIRVRMIGDRTLLPPDLMEAVKAAEDATAEYDGFFLNIALAYGGRNEILQAAREIVKEVRAGKYLPDAITTETVSHHIDSGNAIPPVDLIIRTGNECRTSNFLPWLANGYESTVYFCAPYWPLFRKIDLLRGIRVYSQRIESRQGVVT
jgi:tritrans,polycis-undecaprenyl-diphosphate synthase [geranylgeranyl-diphosphate specific]